MPAVPASDGGLHVLQVPLQRPPALGAAPAAVVLTRSEQPPAAVAGGGLRGSSPGLHRPLPSSPRPGDVRMRVMRSAAKGTQTEETSNSVATLNSGNT